MSILNDILEVQRENDPDVGYITERLQDIYEQIDEFEGFKYTAEMVVVAASQKRNEVTESMLESTDIDLDIISEDSMTVAYLSNQLYLYENEIIDEVSLSPLMKVDNPKAKLLLKKIEECDNESNLKDVINTFYEIAASSKVLATKVAATLQDVIFNLIHKISDTPDKFVSMMWGYLKGIKDKTIKSELFKSLSKAQSKKKRKKPVKEASYYIEFDSLLRYMKENSIIDLREGIANVKRANDIIGETVGLLINTESYTTKTFDNSIESKVDMLKEATTNIESLENLIEFGIPLLKI